MVEKIIQVANGIMVITGNGWNLPDEEISDNDVQLSLKDDGVKLEVTGLSLHFPDDILEHLENAEDTLLYFYGTHDNTIMTEYLGSVSLNRDIFLKTKGAWEFLQTNKF